MRIAHELGKFEYEVEQMSLDEFARWLCYLEKLTPKGTALVG